VADAADKVAEYLQVMRKFMLILNCILTKLSRSIFGIGAAFKRTFTPDLATPISKMKEEAINWPLKIEVGLIGSCTNSSYEDIARAASIAKQVTDKKIKIKIGIYDHPGSEVVRYTIERDGY
jgi:aconitate hydratase